MAITWQNNSDFTFEHWLHLRNQTLGASEVAPIVFGSKYTSNLEIFYRKVGAPQNDISNIRTFIGTETEDISAKMWKYYNGTDQSIVANAKANNLIKDCTNLNSTVFNDKYPNLSATPDRRIEPFGKYKGRGYGSLEIKNTQNFILKSYTDGLPVENVLQLSVQLMLTEWQYGELFYFIDNKTVQCHEIEWNDIKQIEETILLHTVPFFENVIKARPIYNQMYEAQRNHNYRVVAECQKELASLEPPAQNTDGYLKFLDENYKDRLAGVGVITGTEDDKQIARKHKELSKKIKELDAEKRDFEIKLKVKLKEHNIIDFGKEGKVSWHQNKSGSRTFLNNVK